MARVTHISTAVVEANFDYVFVRVYTDEDVHGTGECFFAPGIVPMLQELGDVVVGLDPRQVGPIVRRIRAVLSGPGSPAAAGIGYNALSGIEAALWDVAGKLDGRPVAELLGGRFVDEIPLYMDCHGGDRLESMSSVMRYRTPHWAAADGATLYHDFYYESSETEQVLDPVAWVARAEAAVALGFRKLKFDLDSFATARRTEETGATRGEIAEMAFRACQVRDAVGDDIEVAFDCHWRFDVPTAVRVAEAVEEVRPMWLEDPVPFDLAALAAVQQRTSIPVAAGETGYLVEGFRPLIDARAVSIVTPDAQKCGGLAEAKRIFDDARLANLQAAPHCIASPLGLVATAHACAAVSNVLSIEFHGVDVPFWGELVATGNPIEDGYVRVPNAPGLGVELDEEVVARYSRLGEPVFEEYRARNTPAR